MKDSSGILGFCPLLVNGLPDCAKKKKKYDKNE